MKNKLIFLSNILVSTIPFSFVSCVKIFNSENEEKSKNKEYNDEDALEFSKLLIKYQEDNNIKRIKDYHFMTNLINYKSINYNKREAYEVIKNNYKIIYSFNELQESYLNFFNKSFWENLYNQNPELDKNNYHSLSEEEIQKINKKEFEKYYLDGQDAEKFFENNNLILSQSWYPRIELWWNLYYLIPFFENKNDYFVFKRIKVSDLNYPQISTDNIKYYFDSQLDILKTNKNKKVEIINTPIAEKEAERLFEFLKKKYDVNNEEKENS
ncbi:hypothetical protein [Mycoplasma sp. 5370]